VDCLVIVHSYSYWINNFFSIKDQQIKDYFTCILVNSFLGKNDTLKAVKTKEKKNIVSHCDPGGHFVLLDSNVTLLLSYMDPMVIQKHPFVQ